MTRKKWLEALVRGMAPVIRAFVTSQIAPLETRLADLERRDTATKSSMHFCGVWREGRYDAGAAVTHKGSMWLALRNTAARPGEPGIESRDWQLTVKRGTL